MNYGVIFVWSNGWTQYDSYSIDHPQSYRRDVEGEIQKYINSSARIDTMTIYKSKDEYDWAISQIESRVKNELYEINYAN